MKKLIPILLASFFISLASTSVYAGNYTSSDINKNNSYQRVYAVNYAASYVENSNPYYPFYVYGDCTNFVSQCIYAGGMPMIDNSSYDIRRQWYMNRVVHPKVVNYYKSDTWISAHEFRHHWANVNDIGWNRCYQYKIYSSAYNLRTSNSLWNDLYNRCSGGDVIQYVYGPSNSQYGKTHHSQLVHRRSNPNTTKKISMAQHTTNGWRNLKTQSLANVASDDIICLIRIKSVQRPIDTVNP